MNATTTQAECKQDAELCRPCSDANSVRLTLKPQVESGVAVAPDPQSVQEDWISVLDGEVVKLQDRTVSICVIASRCPRNARETSSQQCSCHSTAAEASHHLRARSAPIEGSVSCTAIVIDMSNDRCNRHTNDAKRSRGSGNAYAGRDQQYSVWKQNRTCRAVHSQCDQHQGHQRCHPGTDHYQ